MDHKRRRGGAILTGIPSLPDLSDAELQCPLWVKSGRVQRKKACPLYTQ
jgi:hypothetical protein